MPLKRPNTAISKGLKSHGINAINIKGRPGSAKDWFEAYNKRRNEEHWRLQEWQDTANSFKKREFESKFYTELGKPKLNNILEVKEKERKEKDLHQRKERLRDLLKEDEKRCETERKEKQDRETKKGSRQGIYPEIEMLRGKLEQLKKKNEIERQKLAEKLSNDAWRKNNAEIRQLESERLTQFVKDAWVDQKKFKEEERRRREEEEKIIEKQAEEARKMHEIEEKKEEEERVNKLAEWKSQLDEQVLMLRNREEEESVLQLQEELLQREQCRLQKIATNRDKLQELHKRKQLEIFWARQFQLKLKKKSELLQEELMQEENILEDLIRGLPQDTTDEKLRERREDAQFMLKVCEEQRRLERAREKEYDLLFSEEAENIWDRREAEWAKEKRSREKLMRGVLEGLQTQTKERLQAASSSLTERRSQKKELKATIEKTKDLIKQEEDKVRGREIVVSGGGVKSILQSNALPLPLPASRVLSREKAQCEQMLIERKKEIARLELEIQNLWKKEYDPPRYGRKKIEW